MPDLSASLAALFSEERSFGIFLLVTIALGGGAGALAGRAIARTWRPWWQVVVYAAILGFAVRFIHFALFEASLLSLYYYVVDAAVCLVLAGIGFRAARAQQMVKQYHWLYRPAGTLRWRRKPV
jgi:hypothetical protein